MTTSLYGRRALLPVAVLSSVILAGCDTSTSGDQTPTSPLAYGTDIGGAGCNIIDVASDVCATLATPPGLPSPAGTPFYIPGTYPRFTPAANDIPLNTDILFSGSTDGTAYVAAANPASPNPVEVGINHVDGWSTTAAFDIGFSAAIDPATVNDGTSADPTVAIQQNVFLVPIETVAGGDTLDPADIDTGAPFSTANVAATHYMTQVLSLDGGTNNVLRVAPTKPLMGPKKYLVIVTNGIKDASAAPITASASYALLGIGDAATCAAAGINAALLPLCTAIDGWQSLAVGYLQARNAQINTMLGSAVLPTDAATLKSSLALTYTFTTTDPVSGLVGMAAPRAGIFQQAYAAGVAAGAPPATAASNAASFVSSIAALLPTPSTRTVAIDSNAVIDIGYLDGNPAGGALSNGVGLMYTGAITLPYYQSAPATSSDPSFVTKHWNADTTLGSALGAALGTGDLPPADTDGSHNVTYRYPFAVKTTNLKIPLQVTVPAVGCAVGGCPVVIYVHGITSDRTSVASLAYNLAANGVATVAIDLPLHGVAANSSFLNYLNVEDHGATQQATQQGLYGGNSLAQLYPGIAERHFNFRLDSTTGAPTAMDFAAPTAADGSGTLFINLSSFANSHDNLQEAVADLLNLNASLQSISNAIESAGVANGFNLGGLNPLAAQVYVTGISLGGIIGTTYAAVNQAAIAADLQAYAATGNNTAFFPTLYPVKALAASVAGGEITKLLENSQAFAPSILAGLDAADGDTSGVAEPNAVGLVQGTSDFEKFQYVLQSVLDAGDPLNFAGLLTSSTLDLTGAGGPDLRVPTLLQEIVGGGDAGDGAYPSDLVVPNGAYPDAYVLAPYLGGIPAPLAGTAGLVTVLGLGNAASDGLVPVGAGGAAITQLAIGYHSSLLTTTSGCGAPCPSAGNALATGELQTEVVSFILSGGAATATGTAGTNAAAPFTTTYTN